MISISPPPGPAGAVPPVSILVAGAASVGLASAGLASAGVASASAGVASDSPVSIPVPGRLLYLGEESSSLLKTPEHSSISWPILA